MLEDTGRNGMELTLGDTVHISEKNVTGMFYGFTDAGEVIVRTCSGVQQVNRDQIERVFEG